MFGFDGQNKSQYIKVAGKRSDSYVNFLSISAIENGTEFPALDPPCFPSDGSFTCCAPHEGKFIEKMHQVCYREMCAY